VQFSGIVFPEVSRQRNEEYEGRLANEIDEVIQNTVDSSTTLGKSFLP
jgi:hypothetical protein